MGHIVTATLIVAKFGDTERYFEKGATLPAGVSAAERKRLVGAGLVTVVEEAPKADPDAEQAAAEAAAKAAAEAEAKAAAEAEAKAKATAAAKTTPAK
jgi:tetraacyldisaccharide-1-P 4'-kinase